MLWVLFFLKEFPKGKCEKKRKKRWVTTPSLQVWLWRLFVLSFLFREWHRIDMWQVVHAFISFLLSTSLALAWWLTLQENPLGWRFMTVELLCPSFMSTYSWNISSRKKSNGSCFQPMCLCSDRVLPGHVWLQEQSRGRAGSEEGRRCGHPEKGRMVCHALFLLLFDDTFLMRSCSLKQDHRILHGSHSAPVAAGFSTCSSCQTSRVGFGKNVPDRDYTMIHVFLLNDRLHFWQSWTKKKMYKNNLFCFVS